MRFPTRTVVMWKIVFSGLLWHHGLFVLSTSNVHAQRGDPFGRTWSSQNKRPHLILEKLGKQAVKMPSWDRPGTPHHDRHPPLHCSGNSSPLGHHSICQQSSLGSTKTIPSAAWTNLKVPMETVPFKSQATRQAGNLFLTQESQRKSLLCHSWPDQRWTGCSLLNGSPSSQTNTRAWNWLNPNRTHSFGSWFLPLLFTIFWYALSSRIPRFVVSSWTSTDVDNEPESQACSVGSGKVDGLNDLNTKSC